MTIQVPVGKDDTSATEEREVEAVVDMAMLPNEEEGQQQPRTVENRTQQQTPINMGGDRRRRDDHHVLEMTQERGHVTKLLFLTILFYAGCACAVVIPESITTGVIVAIVISLVVALLCTLNIIHILRKKMVLIVNENNDGGTAGGGGGGGEVMIRNGLFLPLHYLSWDEIGIIEIEMTYSEGHPSQVYWYEVHVKDSPQDPKLNFFLMLNRDRAQKLETFLQRYQPNHLRVKTRMLAKSGGGDFSGRGLFFM